MKNAKQFIFFLLIVFGLFLPAELFAQDGLVSVHAENQPLSEVLEKVASEHRLKFAYDSDQFSTILANFNIQNKSADFFLQKMKENYSVAYKLLDGTYILFVQAQPLVKKEKVKVEIRGRVSDVFSNEPLMYCHVAFAELKGCYTNDLGNFSFEGFKDDSVRISISHLGYHRLDTIFIAQNNLFFDLKLNPFDLTLPEIKVLSAEKNLLELSNEADVIGFNPTQSSNVPRMDEGDMVNSLSLIPGINFQAGQNSGLSIRGGSPSDNLILLDGIPVLETNHLFGHMSMLNAKFVKQAFVSRGGFDVTNGGRVSGLVKLSGKSARNKKLDADISANLINGNSFLSIPIGKAVSLSGSFRKSFIDQWQNYLFDRLLDVSGNEDETGNDEVSLTPVIHFEDANAKLLIRPGKNHEINFNLLWAKETQFKEFDHNNDRFFRDENDKSNNLGGSMNWSFQIGKWLNSFHVYHTEFERTAFSHSGKYANDNSNNGNDKGKGKGKNNDKNKSEKINLDSDFNSVTEQAISWKSEMKHGIFKHQWGAGFTRDETSYEFQNQQTTGNVSIDSISDNLNAEIAHAYYQQHLSLSEKFSFRAGVRVDYENSQQQFYWQPRGGLYFNPIKELELYYLTGKYVQFLSRVNRIDHNSNIDVAWYLPTSKQQVPMSAIHHIAGFKYENGGFLLNTEFYHKSTSDKRNIYAEDNKVGKDTQIVYESSTGDERTNGMDLLVQYRKKDGRKYWLTPFQNRKNVMPTLTTMNILRLLTISATA